MAQSRVDIEQVEEIASNFKANGGKYVDTYKLQVLRKFQDLADQTNMKRFQDLYDQLAAGTLPKVENTSEAILSTGKSLNDIAVNARRLATGKEE